MALCVEAVTIEKPIKNTSLIGISIPNKKPHTIPYKMIAESEEFVDNNMELPIALGVTPTNKPIIIEEKENFFTVKCHINAGPIVLSKNILK